MKKTLLVFVFLMASSAGAAPPAPQGEPQQNLEDQLQLLGTPGNQAPASLNSEKLYAVQTRYVPLRHRHELSLGMGNNFSADSFLSSQNMDAAYRFYLSNRWYLGLAGNYVFNQLTDAGQQMTDQFGRPPDVGVTKYRADLQVGYHLFYGKFRLSMDRVFYFDQYIALGPGIVIQDIARRFAAVADAGVAMWLGQNFSFRLGCKDYFFQEQRRLSNGLYHNLVGYLQAGYVFGG